MKLKRQIVIPFTIIGLIILIPIYSLIINYFKSASTLSLKSALTEVNLFSHHGKIVNIKDFKDTPTLLFFGFTHCPEVCPTTLSNLLNNIELLEKNKKNYKVLFVTLDPERDTINNLNDYLQNFNSSVIGLTGELNEINKFAKNWNIYWEKVSEGNGYTINHTATVFMINKKGNFAGTIAWGESDKSIKLKLKKLFNL
tara:strand:+ start:101 stop:694 length:594 start_codon:yes stop_codon:yes gene_type:complete